MVPIFIRVFMDSRTAFIAHVVMILICAAAVKYQYEFIILELVAGLVAIYSLRELSQRAQLFRTGVHHVGEGGHAAGDVLRDCDSRIVSGRKHHAVQKIAKGVGIALFKSHQRVSATEVDRFGGNGDHIVEIAFFQRNDAREDLSRACRIDARIRFFFNAAIGNGRILGVYENKIRLVYG